MGNYLLAVSCFVVFLGSDSLHAQTYVVQTKEFAEQGKSVNVLQASTNHYSIRVSLGDKVLKEDKKVEIEEKRYVEKILVAGREKPAKYSYSFTKAVKGNKAAPVELSYAGKTVVFELKGDAYQVMAEGGGVNDKDLADFTRRANQQKIGQTIYSEKPVKVGESWKIGEKVIKLLLAEAPEGTVDVTKMTATGKLLKAYQKNGQQWGTIEVTAKGPAHKLGPLPLSKPVEFQVKITVDTAIDGSSTEGQMKGQMSLKGRSEFVQNNMTFSIDLDLVMDLRQDQSAEK